MKITLCKVRRVNVCFRYYYLFSLSYIIHNHISEAVNIVFSCFCCLWGKEDDSEENIMVQCLRFDAHSIM